MATRSSTRSTPAIPSSLVTQHHLDNLDRDWVFWLHMSEPGEDVAPGARSAAQGRGEAAGQGRDPQRDPESRRADRAGDREVPPVQVMGGSAAPVPRIDAEATVTEAVKETKAQRVERLKREQNPWEAYEDILRFAREGWDSVPPEWFGTYFRWWGIYTQGDGVGAIGGKNGEGKAVRNFMVRIRIPNGALESHQLRTIADLAEWHGGGIGDITVRQNIQLHWVKLESLPE